jgi:hypothetical protein
MVSLTSFAQTCDLYKDCKSFKKGAEVCIVPDNPADDLLGIEKYGYMYIKCSGKQKFVIRDNSDYLKIKKWSAANCTKIDRLIINGHGSEQSMAAGHLSTTNLGDFSDLKCTFNDDAKIELEGCNTGRGCRGQMFMQQVAKAAFVKTGSVIAPTSYATGLLITPHYSINGKHRTLQYNAENKTEIWGFSGIKFGEANAVKQCINEVEEAYSDLKKEEQKQNPRCHMSTNDDLRNLNLLKSAKSIDEIFEISLKPPRKVDFLGEIENKITWVKRCDPKKLGPEPPLWTPGVQ